MMKCVYDEMQSEITLYHESKNVCLVNYSLTPEVLKYTRSGLGALDPRGPLVFVQPCRMGVMSLFTLNIARPANQ